MRVILRVTNREVNRVAEKRLTTRRCDTAKAKATVYRLTDGGGLSLRVMPSGAKYWQYRYRYGERETILQLGSYPAISLERARAEHARHCDVLRHGRDPVTARRVEKAQVRKAAGETFSAVADEWLEYHRPTWSGVHHERNEGLLRRVLRPVLGQLPLREIDATAVLSALKAAENDGILESARRARAIAKQVFDYAIATGRASVNPARDLGKALRKPEVEHFAALQADQIGPFLTVLDASDVTAVTRAALLLMLYTGSRDGSLRGAKWQEVDLKAARWTVPAERMKRREEHSVPLPKQAVTVLCDLARLTDRGPDSYIFASGGKAGYLAENTLRMAMHRLGFEVTAHGFRSLLTDELYKAGFRSEWVERQMHHRDKNAVRAADLLTDFFEQRVPMMQWWADSCDALKAGRKAPALPKNVIPIQRAAQYSTRRA